MLDISVLLDEIVNRDGSDLHLVVGDPPTVRVHGHLVRLEEYGELTDEVTQDLTRQIIPERCVKELQDERGVDFGFAYGDKARFRVAVFYQKYTMALNLRLIPYKIRSFEELGLDQHVQKLCHAPRGLVLVTGPTGSGKTTTLATMIDYINRNRDCHIITIEDPIEYHHSHKKSIISQRQVGDDVPTFDVGVIKALRQDPDVILVGEMRDLKTISAAVRAAETGHLVFSTLHTTGAVRTVDRVVDVFPFDQQEQIRSQLGGNLLAVISQLLLPTPDGTGRHSVYEIMICTPAIQHMIRDRKTHSIFSAIQTGQQFGMKTLDDSLLANYRRGLLAREEMLRVAEHPGDVLQKLGEAVPQHMAVHSQPQNSSQPQQRPPYPGPQQNARQ
ncbi:MAG: PilT/PilU family type 4a pilus ATPase [Armatimonadetes bacterium]|nr:PilT/PilU family type 4a pilus ATPase [Armatimonadota bacterium]